MARNEDTRDKFHTEVIKFELDQILQHFAETIQVINAQFDVVDELFESGKVIEGENIWRAQREQLNLLGINLVLVADRAVQIYQPEICPFSNE